MRRGEGDAHATQPPQVQKSRSVCFYARNVLLYIKVQNAQRCTHTLEIQLVQYGAVFGFEYMRALPIWIGPTFQCRGRGKEAWLVVRCQINDLARWHVFN